MRKPGRPLSGCVALAVALACASPASADQEVQVLAVAAVAVVLAEILAGRSAQDEHAHAVIQGGAFDAVSGDQRATAFGAEYRAAGILAWKLRPFFGAGVTSDQSFYGYGGIRLAARWGRRVVITPSFAIGAYRRGEGKDLGDPPVLGRFGIDLEYAFDNGARVGLAYHHMSNGQALGQSENPGTQIVGLTASAALR